MCPLWFHTNSFSYADAVKLLLKLCLPLPVTLTAHTHVHAHAPTYTYMLHKHLHICASKYSKYLPIYIFSAGFQRPCRCFTVQHLCICMCVHMYHFQNSFSPSHFPSISSFPLKCIPSMATFSFVLSLSLSQCVSLHPCPPPPPHPSCSPSPSLLNLRQSASMERLFSTCMPTPAYMQFVVKGAVVYTSKHRWDKRNVCNVASMGFPTDWQAFPEYLPGEFGFICLKGGAEFCGAYVIFVTLFLIPGESGPLPIGACVVCCCQAWLIWFRVKNCSLMVSNGFP